MQMGVNPPLKRQKLKRTQQYVQVSCLLTEKTDTMQLGTCSDSIAWDKQSKNEFLVFRYCAIQIRHYLPASTERWVRSFGSIALSQMINCCVQMLTCFVKSTTIRLEQPRNSSFSPPSLRCLGNEILQQTQDPLRKLPSFRLH